MSQNFCLDSVNTQKIRYYKPERSGTEGGRGRAQVEGCIGKKQRFMAENEEKKKMSCESMGNNQYKCGKHDQMREREYQRECQARFRCFNRKNERGPKEPTKNPTTGKPHTTWNR